MKSSTLPIIIVAFTLGCISEIKDRIDFLEKYKDKVSKMNSIDFDINYKIKPFGKKDTLNYQVHCSLIREDRDTLFGGAIWLDNDSVEYFYDLKTIYLILHNKKKITKYFPEKTRQFPIKGRSVTEAIEVYFFDYEGLSRNLEDSTVIVSTKDTVFNKSKIKALRFDYQDEDEYVNMQENIFINSDYNIEKRNFYVEDSKQKEFQYNEWNISNIENDNTLENLNQKLKTYKESYSVEDFVMPDQKKLLPIGAKVPNFKGIFFKNDQEFQLSEFEGEAVILDFWYKDCAPCIKSIPFLNELNKKFSSKGLSIFGLNPVNSKEKDYESLSRFVINNEVKYQIALINKEVALNYNVTGFPTFYVIDKKGKVVYSLTGYDKEQEETIEKIITDLLIQ